jgi:xylan 1,4-beta-xylosidase
MNRLSMFSGALLIVMTATAFAQQTVPIMVDAGNKQGNVPHFWEECISSDHMYLTLNPSVQFALKAVRNECGIKRVRGHGILDDDVGIFHWDGVHNPTYNWTKLDSIYDFLVNNNIDPLVELDFMPRDLACDTTKKGCWYGGVYAINSAPKNWGVWRDLVDSLVKHCVNRYGAKKVENWYFEVWNEPNIGFWTGDGNDANGPAWPDDYMRLFDSTLVGAHAADSNVKVGGPACAGGDVTELINHCTSTGKKLGFVSWHAYSGQAGDATADPSIIWGTHRIAIDALRNSGISLPCFNTEFGMSSGPVGGQDPDVLIRDTHFAATYVAKLMKLVLNDFTEGTYPVPSALSYWCLSDIYEEQWAWSTTLPFQSSYGLVTVGDIKKPVFNGYKILHMMGTNRISLTGGVVPAYNDGVDGFATIDDAADSIMVLLYNFYNMTSFLNSSLSTRWCACDGNTGHWWKVDLGANYDLTGTQVTWENAGLAYKYRIETSANNTTWSTAVDKTANTSTSQTQADNFTASGVRYVRITVTGLPSGKWASFYDFKVFSTQAGVKTNIAQSKTASADCEQYAYYASFGNDGDINPASDTVSLVINNLPFSGPINIRHYRIDSVYSNAYTVWVNQGKPNPPNATQLNAIKAAQDLAECEPAKDSVLTSNSWSKKIVLPKQAMSLLVVKGGLGTHVVARTEKPTTKVPAIRLLGQKIVFSNLDKNVASRIMLVSINGRIIQNICLSGQTGYLLKTEKYSSGTYVVVLSNGIHAVRQNIALLK